MKRVKKTKDCKGGCDLGGNRPHSSPSGGIPTIVEDSDKEILVESGEIVITKPAVQDTTVKTYTGTNKEILNKINTGAGGNPIMKRGGKITKRRSKKCKKGMKTQSVIVSKEDYTEKQAKKWMKEHGYKDGVDEKTNTLRFRQENPDNFKKDSFRTIPFTEGVQAVVGCPKYEGGGEIAKFYALTSDGMHTYRKFEIKSISYWKSRGVYQNAVTLENIKEFVAQVPRDETIVIYNNNDYSFHGKLHSAHVPLYTNGATTVDAIIDENNNLIWNRYEGSKYKIDIPKYTMAEGGSINNINNSNNTKNKGEQNMKNKKEFGTDEDNQKLARAWWSDTLSLNQQNDFIKKYHPEYYPDYMRTVIYGKNNTAIVNMWKGEQNMEKDVNDVRESHSKLSKTAGDRIAVIVETEYETGKFNKGVQYWTKEQIEKGVSTNTDHTTSKFIEKLAKGGSVETEKVKELKEKLAKVQGRLKHKDAMLPDEIEHNEKKVKQLYAEIAELEAKASKPEPEVKKVKLNKDKDKPSKAEVKEFKEKVFKPVIKRVKKDKTQEYYDRMKTEGKKYGYTGDEWRLLGEIGRKNARITAETAKSVIRVKKSAVETAKSEKVTVKRVKKSKSINLPGGKCQQTIEPYIRETTNCKKRTKKVK